MDQRRFRVAGAPALAVFEDSPERAGRKGTILFHHGFTAVKEGNLKELEDLARHGFLAVGIDAVDHGERKRAGFDEHYGSGNPRHEAHFVDAVRRTAGETPAIIDELARTFGIDTERVGLCGISMGGFVAYAALTVEPRLAVATPILGSPEWRTGDADSPHRHPDRFFPRAILSQTAGEDRSVPPRAARELHRVLQPRYAPAPERLAYVEFSGAGHFMPPGDWEVLWSNVVRWYERFLGQRA